MKFKIIKNKKQKRIAIVVGALIVAFFLFGFYMPHSFAGDSVFYEVKKGAGSIQIARDLMGQKIIKSSLFFNAYALASLSYNNLQAGRYQLSSAMSVADIVSKLATGDVVKKKITIFEGWSILDIAKHLEDEGIFKKEDFLLALEGDLSKDFYFLSQRPNGAGLEGYIFPDSYYFSDSTTPEKFLWAALSNFEKKISVDLREETARQGKSLYEIVTMASILEKEVKSIEDKKIISGILWKRIKEGMPLQVDATVNYVTGKHDVKAALKDTKIDSPYNTYKYYGLPKGPISNPGLDSILAAIYPEESPYWYYLSADGNGQTVFSKTFQDHLIAQAKYFK